MNKKVKDIIDTYHPPFMQNQEPMIEFKMIMDQRINQ